MNKTVKLSISIIIVTIVISIFLTMYFTIFVKSDESDFSLNTHSLVLEIGESKDLKELYTIENNSNILISCFVSDLRFAEINEDNIITAKSVGETKILFKRGNNLDFEEDYINLSVVETPIIPTSFSFDKSEVTLSLETEYVINNMVCNETYNVTPTITYSVNNICEYNLTTGKIYPIAEGSTIVTVTFTNNGNIISKSFAVNVKNNYRNFSIDLTKVGDYYILSMSANKITSFEVFVYENNNITNVKINYEFIDNVTNATFIQYEANIVMIKATTSGETILKLSCEDDPSVFALIKLIVE